MTEPSLNTEELTTRNTSSWERLAKMLTVTKEQVADMESAVSLWNDLIFLGQFNVWVAKPNGGKTSIAIQAAGDIARDGYKVCYFNLDASGGDLRYYQNHAEAHGYRLIAPMAEGTTEQDCVKLLDDMACDTDLSNVVVFLDTLKQFTEVIHKGISKQFYRKLRRLTLRGCTVLALGHTNKSDDHNGRPIFEGTGDLKSDCDNLIYLIPTKDEQRGITLISTEIEKERALIIRRSFEIDEDRNVTLRDDFIDAQVIERNRKFEAKNEPLISFIQEQLRVRERSQSELVRLCKEADMGSQRAVQAVLARFVDKHWNRERGSNNNRWCYYLGSSLGLQKNH